MEDELEALERVERERREEVERRERERREEEEAERTRRRLAKLEGVGSKEEDGVVSAPTESGRGMEHAVKETAG